MPEDLPGDSLPAICGLGLASALGIGEDDHIRSVRSGGTGFKPLGELFGYGEPWSGIKAAWLDDRALLSGRRQGPASQLALLLARQAVLDAGWDERQLNDCAIVVGSSRGNAAGWLDPWPGRRSIGLLSAPHSLHSELASTLSIELGVEGPYHVLASGCAAGLDALGMASLLIRSGTVKRVLAVGLDLPLSPALLKTYWSSRMLSTHGRNDPYHPDADGMLIGEGGAALALCRGDDVGEAACRARLVDYRSNSDAYSPLGMRPGGERLGDLIRQGVSQIHRLGLGSSPLTLCPHASGTRGNALSECAAWGRAFENAGMPDFRMLKPYVGHTIGGSGILELALLLAFANRGVLPPNPRHVAKPDVLPRDLSRREDAFDGSVLLMKTAASLGGHNALVSVLAGPRGTV